MLIMWAIERGRKTKPDLNIGICGEHGGDSESVKFCHRVGDELRERIAVSACPFPASPQPRRFLRGRKLKAKSKQTASFDRAPEIRNPSLGRHSKERIEG